MTGIIKLRTGSTLCIRRLNFTKNTFLSTSSSLGNKRAALIFSGSGVYDGTELHEASACLLHLSRHRAEVSMFAPDVKQLHVINHAKGRFVEI